MTHRRDSGSDVVHVIPTNDPPPENRFPNPDDNTLWATEDDYNRIWSLNLTTTGDDTASPSKKTRGSPSSIGKPPFKTKLCSKFRGGTCSYLTNCYFAHNMEELRRLPLNWQEEERSVGGIEPREEFKIPSLFSSAESGRSYKGRHCKKFYSGEGCPYGETCTFLHDEASRHRESFAISLGPSPSSGGYGGSDGRGIGGSSGGSGNVVVVSGGGDESVKPPNWKTRICNKWEITGYCPFAAKCHFAHGSAELQRFGGGLVEGDEAKTGTSTSEETKQTTGQVDTVTTLVSPGVQTQRISPAITHKPSGVRTQRKWKGPDKISRIYGDWIDDNE